jgi:hypothetical protein
MKVHQAIGNHGDAYSMDMVVMGNPLAFIKVYKDYLC